MNNNHLFCDLTLTRPVALPCNSIALDMDSNEVLCYVCVCNTCAGEEAVRVNECKCMAVRIVSLCVLLDIICK